MGDAQTRLAFDFSGAREIRYVSGVPEVGDFITRRQELWVVRKIEEDGGGLVISCELPRTESKDSSRGGAGTQRLQLPCAPLPALIVRFPGGSKEFRYPETPLGEGDAIWHDNVRYHVVSVTENDGGDQLTVTVEPDTESIGDLLSSEEGALVLVAAKQADLEEEPRRRLEDARARGTYASVYLAGLQVPDDDVRVLITLVDEPTRSLLEKSLALETGVVALTIDDRERILWALDDVRTDALAELRGVLLSEHEWRPHDRLVQQREWSRRDEPDRQRRPAAPVLASEGVAGKVEIPLSDRAQT